LIHGDLINVRNEQGGLELGAWGSSPENAVNSFSEASGIVAAEVKGSREKKNEN
jgi:hypothetical protein